MSPRAAQMTMGSIVLLAAWLGAAVFIAAIVAPAAFAVLPTRALAGTLVGRALPALFTTGIAIAVAVLILHQVVAAGRLVGASSAIFLIAIGAASVVALRISSARTALGVPIDSLDIADPRRIAFGRLHGLSVLLMGIGMLGALAALVALSRHLLSRSTA